MSLNMYLGEVDTQTSTITDICNETIHAMKQVIQSIDTFTGDVILKGVTYDSAKIYFSQTYRLLAQGIIIYCEELIRQNQAFPANFRSEVADTDIMEEEVKEQIREAEIMVMNLEEASSNLAVAPQTTLFDSVKRNLERKLEDLYYFNSQSSAYFEGAKQLAKDIESGLSNIQGGKGFSQTSSAFSLTGITVDWQTALRKANDAVKIKELKNYDVYAVVYLDAKGEAQIHWHLEKDGKGVTNPELYSYLFQSGKYLDGEDYTIWSMDDYNARLKDGWRKGINYQNGDEYNPFISGTLVASQYVDDGYVWTQETGMYDIILMAGLSYSSYKLAKLNNGSSNTVEDIPKRPSWKQAETDALSDFPEYEAQKSFLNGKEVPYGTKGSTRPDLFKLGSSIEVKAYDVQSSTGRNNVINNVVKQIQDRVTHLPQGTKQTILLDIRGQTVTNEVLKEIRNKIIEKTGVSVEIIFKR
ncbi:hypothetical protein [Listeria welshimeri]|uniref:hypothetical protein n=1 Tax=Listeria welshimeri TaxID=1643 RepID=UPI00188711C1|nr:hypothetical protein [Listeria welshimeri]MBF2456558.1 hypothetical protein [Listeria welshimeri]MBF2482939.1 hypothetical protein [Listeria welshimeri]MBF2568391.1 hypothetical protein [Listeria welshimeri]